MQKLLKNFKPNFMDNLLSFLWRSWSTLGVYGNVTHLNRDVIDPEALFLLTASVGRSDPRLFDEMLDWVTKFEDLLNASRMKVLMKKYPWQSRQIISAVAAWLLENGGQKPKWNSLAAITEEKDIPNTPFFLTKDGDNLPVFGQLDPVFEQRGLKRGLVALRQYSRKFNPENAACLILNMRSLFGTNASADLVSYLLTHPSGGNPTHISGEIGHFQKTVHLAFVRMAGSHVFSHRPSNKRYVYSLDSGFASGVLQGLANRPQWKNNAARLFVLDQVWQKLNEDRFLDLDERIQLIELRETLKVLRGTESIPELVDFLEPGQNEPKMYLNNLTQIVNQITSKAQ